MKKNQFPDIPQSQFELVNLDERIHDQKFETKPLTYFQDAMRRFVKNKASVVATYIIGLILLFAIVAPFVSKFHIGDYDGVYARTRPKIKAFERSGFWDGTQKMQYNDKYMTFAAGIGMGAADPEGTGKVTWDEGMKNPYTPIVNYRELTNPEEIAAAQGEEGQEEKKKPKKKGKKGKQQHYYAVTVDSYYLVGFRYQTMTAAERDRIFEFEKKTGLKVFYPMVDTLNKYCAPTNAADANYWYRHNAGSTPMSKKGKPMTIEEVMKDGLVPNYLYDQDGNVQYFKPKNKNMIEARVLYYNYFIFKNGVDPSHTFGADGQGYDILVRMAHGIRLSVLLSIFVSLINLTFGAFYGAIEGYYGGWVDMLMERINDIISGIPFLVTASLFQLHLVQTGKVSPFVGLLFAFCLTGWIGTAYRVRTQFYRFKKEEYILAARTLGASDGRLMFKHIFPNALGTMITSSVLVIPGTIMSESTLSYLGIVNFNGKTMTSLGTMLGNAQGYLAKDPHILFFPAMVISLLMISFNLFGNGLRDAFNPSLRGADE